jgi:hypothetical protein
MACFIVNASKRYVANMLRTWEVEVDEEEFIKWVNEEVFTDNETPYTKMSDIRKDMLEHFTAQWISEHRLHDMDSLVEEDELEGHYKAQHFEPAWSITIENADCCGEVLLST